MLYCLRDCRICLDLGYFRNLVLYVIFEASDNDIDILSSNIRVDNKLEVKLE